MRTYRLLLVLALFCSAAIAQTITGTITNGTTGKPAAGVDVALVDPMQGMAELTTAKTGNDGGYALKSPGPAQGPRLVRATRDGVNYFKMAPPGTQNIFIDVYDAAKSVAGITGTMYVVRAQTEPNTMDFEELYVVNNASSPAKSLAAETTFEFVVPDGAQFDGADAQGPNGQPIQVTPTPLKQKGHYAFSYAIKPGETRFQVGYHVPYSGRLTISPQFTMPFQHFAVQLPGGINFNAKTASQFSALPQQPGVMVATNVKPGQAAAFELSGNGAFPAAQPQDAQSGDAAGGGGPSAQPDNRPGGGLGAPIDAPDALEKYRWPLLTLLTAILLAGGFIVSRRKRGPAVEAAAPVSNSRQDLTPASSAAGGGNALLAAMKDELFQLEIERANGSISAAEYEKAKAALDQTLARALARGKRGTAV